MCDGNDCKKDNLIVLTDEDGNEVKFELIGDIVYEGEHYIVVADPEVDPDEDGEIQVVILRQDDGDEYSVLDDESLTEEILEVITEKDKSEDS